MTRQMKYWLLTGCLAASGILTTFRAGYSTSLSIRSSGEVRHAAFLFQEQEEDKVAKAKEGTYKLINFIILAVGLGFLLRKPLSRYLQDRSQSIRKGLDEGRRALGAAEDQLKEVQEKVASFQKEVEALRMTAQAEMEVERQRLRDAARQESERIIGAAHAQIQAAVRAAKMELGVFAINQATELAARNIEAQMNDDLRSHLVARFVDTLNRTH